ncbi:hypothetical protein [Aliiroseovarius sediminilitoris]|uniref:hypothetical protein n=1 Tax=Aliiroseovarius sediminilitoris TaxID=1173584 RepID=UPI00115FC144|nr:hypothetical protein [Aliiroseovarius sediminilitoris]
MTGAIARIVPSWKVRVGRRCRWLLNSGAAPGYHKGLAVAAAYCSGRAGFDAVDERAPQHWATPCSGQ